MKWTHLFISGISSELDSVEYWRGALKLTPFVS